MTRTPSAEDWPVSWAIAVPLLSLLPFVALTALAYPHDDDFYFGSLLNQHGFLGMLGEGYRTVAGRLFCLTIIVVPNLAQQYLGLDWLFAYRAFCALVLVSCIALSLWLASILLPNASRRARLFLGTSLACVLVSGSPAPNDFYFWVSQIANYTLAAMAALAIMIWMDSRHDQTLSVSQTALLCSIGFVTATATEMSGAILFLVIVASYVDRVLAGAPRASVAYALILSAIALGTLVVAAAPSGANRMAVYGQSHHLAWNALMAFPIALLRLLHFLAQRATSPALLAWPLIVGLASWHADRGAAAVERLSARRIWLPLLSVVAAAYCALWLGQLGMGRFLPPRARSHLHFVLVGGLALTSVRFVRAHRDDIRAWFKRRWPAIAVRHLTMMALALLLLAPHTWMAWNTMVRDTGAVAAAIDDRFARLSAAQAAAAPEVALPPLPAGWPVVGQMELSTNPHEWRNLAMARYYHVGAVHLQAGQ